MTVCILGNGLTALTLAKALVNHEIKVDVFLNKKNLKINDSSTIGITKDNIDFFNKNIINLEKIIWKLNKIEIAFFTSSRMLHRFFRTASSN